MDGKECENEGRQKENKGMNMAVEISTGKDGNGENGTKLHLEEIPFRGYLREQR